MTVEQKQLIQMQFQMLKQTMKKEGLVFAILVDEKDIDNSSLTIMDRESAVRADYEGISISLTDLNRGLV